MKCVKIQMVCGNGPLEKKHVSPILLCLKSVLPVLQKKRVAAAGAITSQQNCQQSWNILPVAKASLHGVFQGAKPKNTWLNIETIGDKMSGFLLLPER